MAVCYDTNILLIIARDPSKSENVRSLVNPLQEVEFISIVSSAELRSLAEINNWGPKKVKNIDILLSDINIINVDNDLLVDRYVAIDVFSRKKGVKRTTAANTMGKNDLWIAATASLLKLQLISTDGDYRHLDSFLTCTFYRPGELTGL